MDVQPMASRPPSVPHINKFFTNFMFLFYHPPRATGKQPPHHESGRFAPGVEEQTEDQRLGTEPRKNRNHDANVLIIQPSTFYFLLKDDSGLLLHRCGERLARSINDNLAADRSLAIEEHCHNLPIRQCHRHTVLRGRFAGLRRDGLCL